MIEPAMVVGPLMVVAGCAQLQGGGGPTVASGDGEGHITDSPQHLGGGPGTLIRIIADPTEQGVAR